MATEIYLEEEVESLIHNLEDLEQWNKQVEALGLKGQKSLAAPEKSPVPFPYMNYTMGVVYKTLCPRSFLVEDYDKTPIPIRVLSVLALAQKEEYFEKIEVWIDDQEPDPVLIGLRWKPGVSYKYEGNADRYILARWGDEIRPFGELRKKALERLKTAWEIELSELRNKLSGLDPELLAKRELSSDRVVFSNNV